MNGGVLLASGGLDSTTLAYWLLEKGANIEVLFIDYGQHCAHTEAETLRNVLPPTLIDRVTEVKIGDVYRGVSSRLISEANLWEDDITAADLYLPYRNLLLLSTAAAFAQARQHDTVFAGFINSNHAKEIDCSTAFFASLANVFADFGGVRIELPFREMAKVDVVRIALQHDVQIGLTYSCQAASVIPCGACPNCVDRLDALAELGLL